jgi:hypothetical protein
MKNVVFWDVARGSFHPEDGGDTFLRNVGLPEFYTAPHNILHSSNPSKFTIHQSIDATLLDTKSVVK